jgi:hypothetical protein
LLAVPLTVCCLFKGLKSESSNAPEFILGQCPELGGLCPIF